MRYVEVQTGNLILAPRRAVGHVDMVRACGVMRSEVLSAGFVSLCETEQDEPEVYGQSVGLGVDARVGVVIPADLYTARSGNMILVASQRDLLEGLEDLGSASWGLTAPSPWGDVSPVFAPLHAWSRLHAGGYIRD